MKIIGVDHVVLRVRDVAASAAWYHERLGLGVERLEEWRSGTSPFVSLRIDATTIIDLIEGEFEGVNVDHIALVVDDVDLAEIVATGDWDVEMGPTPLSGAQGRGTGVYLRDPDGHRLELRTYP